MAGPNGGGKFAAFEIEVDQPARLKLLDKKRQPYRGNNGSEAWIELHSADSEIARKHRRAVQRKRLAMRGRGKLTPEELEAEDNELFVALTTGWDLVITDVQFSQENARELYANKNVPHIREQIEEFVYDRENFSRASSES
jgi:hypothetical protein